VYIVLREQTRLKHEDGVPVHKCYPEGCHLAKLKLTSIRRKHDAASRACTEATAELVMEQEQYKNNRLDVLQHRFASIVWE